MERRTEDAIRPVKLAHAPDPELGVSPLRRRLRSQLRFKLSAASCAPGYIYLPPCSVRERGWGLNQEPRSRESVLELPNSFS